MALGIPGLRVGCWTSEVSGCTVLLPPEGTLGAVAVRGAGPGTREAIALGANGKLTVCHGVVLSGGSAFGLASADGVVRWLEERGIGYPVGPDEEPLARVPIVGAAILLDASVVAPDGRPDASAGYDACGSASEDDPPQGSHGAGRGCMVAKVAGLEHGWRGGQGAAVRHHGELTVGALVANNAVGEVFEDDGTPVAASRAPGDAPRFPYDAERVTGARDAPGGVAQAAGGGSDPGGVAQAAGGGSDPGGGVLDHTVIGCVATNARLTKGEAVRVAELAHGGIARAVRPAHTSFDGDALFCLATQQVRSHLDLVVALAVDAVAEAARAGVRAATAHGGVPAVSEGS